MEKQSKRTVAERVQAYLALSRQPKTYDHIAAQLGHPNTQHVLDTCQQLATAKVITECGGGYFYRPQGPQHTEEPDDAP